MKNELHALVTDTLAFFKEEDLYCSKVFVPKPKTVSKKVAPTPSPAEKPKEPVSIKNATSDVALFTKIERHLPMIPLTKHIPIPKTTQVAILVYDAKDLFFLKKLAKAIQDQFCPVRLIDGKKVTDEFFEKNSFSLLLSQKKMPWPTPKCILLASGEAYQKNSALKKQLWKEICNHLSPK